MTSHPSSADGASRLQVWSAGSFRRALGGSRGATDSLRRTLSRGLLLATKTRVARALLTCSTAASSSTRSPTQHGKASAGLKASLSSGAGPPSILCGGAPADLRGAHDAAAVQAEPECGTTRTTSSRRPCRRPWYRRMSWHSHRGGTGTESHYVFEPQIRIQRGRLGERQLRCLGP